jgi:hypothetical protein
MRWSEHVATVGGVVEAGVGLRAFWSQIWRVAVSYGALGPILSTRSLGTLSAESEMQRAL